MDQRERYFDQMKDRFDTIEEERVELDSPEKPTEEKPVALTGKHEYLSRVKARLNAWVKELDRWETEATKVDLNEKCTAQLVKLDQKLAEGYEKMRDLMGTTDEDWDSIREEADILWEDIMSTFDQVRECAGSGFLY